MVWPSKIINALVGSTQQFGGDIMNLFHDLVTGVNIAASDSTLKPDIATEFNFRNSLLGIKTPNNNNRFYFEVLANPSTAEDKKIGIPALILQTDNLVFNSQPATLTGKVMDYTQNTFQNFPPVGNAAGNTATFSGNASNKIFTMAHGYSGTPNSVVVVPKSIDALGDYVVTWDATNITVTYQQAPATGTNNVVLSWMIATSISTSGFTPGSTDTLTNKDLTDPSNTFPTSLERTANKNATNGYAGLTSGLIALSQIPTLDNAHLPSSLSGITIDFNTNTIQNMRAAYDYYFFKSGSTYYALNGSTLKLDYSGTDIGAVVNSAVTALSSTGGRFFFSGDNFTINTPISIPLPNTGVGNFPFYFQGVATNNRQTGTTFTIGSSFPTQRFCFEGIASVGSGKRPVAHIDGFFFYNPFATSSTAGQNIAGGSTVIDAGGIYLSADYPSANRSCFIEHISGQYMWRMLHIGGWFDYFYVNDIYSTDSNSTFVGDYIFCFDYDGHVDANFANTPVPGKLGYAANLRTSHIGKFNYGLIIGTIYGNYYNINLDGTTYVNGPVAFIAPSFSNSIFGMTLIDMTGVPSPDNRIGSIIMDQTTLPSTNGTGGYANGPNAAYGVFNNRIYSAETANYGPSSGYAWVLKGGAHHNYLEASPFGTNTSIRVNDAGAGVDNVLYIKGGHGTTIAGSIVADSKAFTSNGLVKVMDLRQSASTKGLSATQSGDGSTKVFNIAHGLLAAPSYADAKPASTDARGTPTITSDATNIIITYAIAPPSGTNNLQWNYIAEVYN